VYTNRAIKRFGFEGEDILF